MCSYKSKGGIEIKSFSKMNKTLLCKWSWRFVNDRNALRRKVICCKFGESVGGWYTCDLRGGYGTSLWKEIRKEWLGFIQNAVFALGDGRRINFRNDVSCGEETLSSSFPFLFSLALNKETKVVDIWESREGAGCWSPTFIRPLNDWELKEMIRFLQTLHDQNFRPTGEDKILLKNAKEKGFSVKIMYKGFDTSLAVDFPYRLVWNPVIPPKNWSLCLG